MSIDGNELNNTLTGTLGDDIINGFGGNDTINATQGSDVVDGGDGNDRLVLSMYDPNLFAAATGSRTYTITAGGISDSSGTISTSISGVETVELITRWTGDYGDVIDASGWTSSSTDVSLELRLGDGNDTVIGSEGSDAITTGLGINTIDTGGGNDFVFAEFDNSGGATAYVTGSDGQVIFTLNGVQIDTIINAESVIAFGENQDAALTVVDASNLTGFDGLQFWDNNGTNISIGSPGHDIFRAMAVDTLGNDVLTGGGGADVYDYTFAIGAMNGDTITDFGSDDVIDLSHNTPEENNGGSLATSFIGGAQFSGAAGEYRYEVISGHTELQVDTDGDGIADQVLTLANAAVALGEIAPNVLMSFGISGTQGNDTFTGTKGDDSYYAQGGNDTINATQGSDFIDGSGGIDRLVINAGDTARFDLAGGARTYTITSTSATDSSGLLNTGMTSIERITLDLRGTGDFDDTVDLSGFITSATVPVRIFTGNGDNHVTGSNYDDSITLGTGSNVVDAGGGIDGVVVAFNNDNPATLFVSGSGGTVETSFNGNSFNSIANAEYVDFLPLNYNGSSTIDASAVTGFSGQIGFRDTNGSDVFVGHDGRDFFANTYIFTGGGDTYTGNGGADIYDYTWAVGAMDGDTITDLDSDDIIDFQYNDPTYNGGGLLADQFIGSANFTGVAGQYRYFSSGGQTFVQADTNGDGVADETLTIANGQFALGETSPGSNQLQIIGTSGTSGNDTLTGTLGDDSIYAQAGNDIINGSQGTDFINGGNGGGDRLSINTGDGSLFTLATGARTYTIGTNSITDSSGTLNTSFTAVERIAFSTIGNGDFDDMIDASGFVSPNANPLDIRLGNGDNIVTGSGGNDRVFTGFGSNVIDGGGGNDTGFANVDASSDVTVTLGNVGGTLTVTANGITNSFVNVETVVAQGVGAGTVTLDSSGYSAIPGVLLILGGHNGSDIMIGSSGSDFFANTTGQVLGNDVYTGNGGADIYDYTYAADSMNGDTITDLDSDDVIDLRFNNLELGGSPIVVNQFIGSANFTGVAGQYRYFSSGGQTFVQADSNGDMIADQTLTVANGQFALGETAAGSNILHIIGASGTSGSDTLTGTLGDDSIYAQGSNDIINGSQGSDFINGGNGGGDRLFMNTGDASLFTLATGARTYTIGANSITDSSGTLNTSFTAVERIAFSTVGNGDFDDVIDASGFVSANANPLDIRLGNGDNQVIGSSVRDRVFTGFGNTIADGGDGVDYGSIAVDCSTDATVVITNSGGTLITTAGGVTNSFTNFEEVWVAGFGSGALTLDASGYAGIPGASLILVGHDGTDIMIGSAGNDFFANITGQVQGNDVYTGNGGADIYDYTWAADSMNGDTITDFDIDDVIDMRFNNLELGGSPVVANHFIGDAAFSGVAGEYRYQIDGTQTVVQVDSDGDTIVDQTLTISNGGFALAETSAGSNILTLAAVINPLDGVVADGYVAGATLFVDVNSNGVRDAGEAWTTTDANGNFTLNVNQAGTIVAIGGVNADTGLANTMTLMAPTDSGVVNPLTTLVQTIVQASGGATTADQASAQVLAALGLDPTLDILNLDLLAQGSDPAALEAQKAAAMIANLVSSAEGATGADTNTESALIGALAGLVTDAAPGATVDLTDAATLTPLLTEALPNTTDVSTIANEVAAESETIAAATSIDGISDAQLDAAQIDYSLDNVIAGDEAANHLFGFGGNDTLTGQGGDDVLEGGAGLDFLWGGSGNDIFVAENSATKVQAKPGMLSMDVIFDFAAGDRIDLRDIDANATLAGDQVFNFKGTNANKLAGDLSYKVYDSVTGAEKALGHDIDGVSGPSQFSGPVTIVYGNVDGGNPDFAIVLIGVNGVSSSDFLFA